MNIQNINDKNKLFWILQTFGWIGLGLIYLFLYYRQYLTDPKSLLAIAITYITGFATSLLLRFFYQRVHYQSRSIGNLSVLVVLSTLVAANIWFTLDISLSIPIHGSDWVIKEITLQRYFSETYWHGFILGTWSALYFVIKLWIEWTRQKERAFKATALAQEAQLQMLRYQLNPHFLFNALNSIRALVDENQKHAKEMITELSEFLRYSLISKNFSDVPLKQELEAIRHYFRVEKKRYEEKLQVTYEINPLAEEYPVLSFLLHPLVENAVKYGMQTSEMPLQILLKAEIVEDNLRLNICNSGKWIEPESNQLEQKKGTGTGLNNIRQRLENAFPDTHAFRIIKNPNQVCVQIEISKTLNEQNENEK